MANSYFNARTFLERFEQTKGVLSADEELEKLVSRYPADVRGRVKHAYNNAVKVLKARSLDDVGEISLQEMLDCFAYQELFYDIFGKQDTSFLSNFLQKYPKVVSLRARRRVI